MLCSPYDPRKSSAVDAATELGMASLGMALQPANAVVGDPFRFDSDEDSGREDDDNNETVNTDTSATDPLAKKNNKEGSVSYNSAGLMSGWGLLGS